MADAFQTPDWTNRKEFETVYDTFKKGRYNKEQRLMLINSIRAYFVQSGDMEEEILNMSLKELNKQYGQSDFYDEIETFGIFKHRSSSFQKYWTMKSVILLDFYLSWHLETYKDEYRENGILTYGRIVVVYKK